MSTDLTRVLGRGMDEATLECAICDGPGYLEVQVQALNNEAEWVICHRYVTCEGHLDRLHLSFSMLDQESRIVAQRCS